MHKISLIWANHDLVYAERYIYTNQFFPLQSVHVSALHHRSLILIRHTELMQSPWVANPSCLQTTAASVVSQLSLQTVPHCPPMQTSTLPSCSSLPPVSLMSVSLQDGPKRHMHRKCASHAHFYDLLLVMVSQIGKTFISPWAYRQFTKQLRMSMEAVSFQLTRKLIVQYPFCSSLSELWRKTVVVQWVGYYCW